MENISIDLLVIILTALTAFFTLVTGAFAIAATFTVFYIKKLAFDRREEVKKLNQLEQDFKAKINTVAEKLEHPDNEETNKKELESLKRDYAALRNQFYHTSGAAGGGVLTGSPTVADLQQQISSLLAQIHSLQIQLADHPNQED